MMPIRAQTESPRRLSDCITALLRHQPFFGNLALRLPLRADASRKTLASNGREILYSPQWIADTGADIIQTAIARIVLACALKHHTRRGERDSARWQLASQLVTHGLLRDSGFTVPADADAWDNLSVEDAYDRLPEPKDDNNEAQTAASPPIGTGNTTTPTSHSNATGNGDANDSTSPSDNANRQNPTDSGASFDPAAPASIDPSGTGEILDATDPDNTAESNQAPINITAEEQAWDAAMHQALNLAKTQGKAPGQIEDTIRNAHVSTLDWRTLLRRYLTDTAHNNYSWSRPNRRFIDTGLYLPSIHSEGIQTIAVIIDTSGSLPTNTLSEFWTEVREITANTHPESVFVLQVDAALQDATEYTAADLPDKIALKGRGGTDFRPGFEWLAEQGLQPSVCLYFTDMKCNSYPDIEPAYPVIWCNWAEAPHGDTDRAPWGERIDIATT